MNDGTVANILKLIALTAEFAARAKANHDVAVKMAEEAGITPEQISEATTRWTQPLIDPLATMDTLPPPSEPPAKGAYDKPFDTEPDDADYKSGDRVMWFTGGEFVVWKVERKQEDDAPVIGHPGWKLHHVIP